MDVRSTEVRDHFAGVNYGPAENAVWKTLFDRQTELVRRYASDEYVHGLKILDLPSDRVPNLEKVSAALMGATGWSVTPVQGLVTIQEFFVLLAQRRFPAATFFRSAKDLGFCPQPDYFHEIFGHCPLLTNPIFADFMYHFGVTGLHAEENVQGLLSRFYWYTAEVGLVQTRSGIKAYGAAIVSSNDEIEYSLTSRTAARRPFHLSQVLRAPYGYDTLQPDYFVLPSFEKLSRLDCNSLLVSAKEICETAENSYHGA